MVSLRHRHLHHLLAGFGGPDVAGNEGCGAACGHDVLDRLGAEVFDPVDADDVGTFAGSALRGPGTHSARAPEGELSLLPAGPKRQNQILGAAKP